MNASNILQLKLPLSSRWKRTRRFTKRLRRSLTLIRGFSRTSFKGATNFAIRRHVVSHGLLNIRPDMLHFKSRKSMPWTYRHKCIHLPHIPLGSCKRTSSLSSHLCRHSWSVTRGSCSAFRCSMDAFHRSRWTRCSQVDRCKCSHLCQRHKCLSTYMENAHRNRLKNICILYDFLCIFV